MSSQRRHGSASRSRGPILSALLSAILLAGVSGLTAGRGNLGGERSVCCSSVQVVANGTSFSETIVSGDTTVSLRNRLVATIDAHPSFSATAYVDPLDPNDVSLEVTTQSGARLSSFQMCEDGARIETLGVSAALPKDRASFAKATAITGVDSDPNSAIPPFYTLTIRLDSPPTYSMTYDTSVAPNNTAAGLNNSVKGDLIAAGFSVSDDSVSLTLTRAGSLFLGVKQVSTDTGFARFCGGVAPSQAGGGAGPTAVPTLSQAGMFALVLILTLAAAAILRRKGGRAGGTPR